MRDGAVISMAGDLQRQMTELGRQSQHNDLILSTQLEHMNNRIAAIQDVLFSRFSIFVGLLGLVWPGGVHRILAWRERIIAQQMIEYAQEVKARRDKARAERQAKIQVVKPHETHGLVKA